MSTFAAEPEAGVEIKVVGKSGQISLGKRYAGKILRLERQDDGAILLTAVAMVPESQLWTLQEPHRSRIQRGLAWAERTPPADTDLDQLLNAHPLRRGHKRKRARAR
jgi:hypothetical protein